MMLWEPHGVGSRRLKEVQFVKKTEVRLEQLIISIDVLQSTALYFEGGP